MYLGFPGMEVVGAVFGFTGDSGGGSCLAFR